MTTSSATSFPHFFTEIDQLTRGDHTHLVESDRIFFLGEYSARKGFSHSATNDLILNFKKKMDRRGTREWSYKDWAIRTAAHALNQAFGNADLTTVTFVPVLCAAVTKSSTGAAAICGRGGVKPCQW